MSNHPDVTRTPAARKKPGRVPGPPTVQTSLWLPPDLLEWAKNQPEGLAALTRALLERERQRRVA